MKLRTFFAFTFAGALGLTACREAMPPGAAIANLQSPRAEDRTAAADALRTPNGVPPEAVPALLAAASQETSAPARGAMLITLGKSGSPAAKPLIDQAVMTATGTDTRRWAVRALKYWLITTGQMPADYAFPKDWPYGQPGYPPPLPR